eukprot:SM000077S21541  [mRNA]  locus=s77:41844:44466:- [translate_table: standard]
MGHSKKGLRGSTALRRKFLLRLAIALHSYGSSAPRTEFLVEKAADRIGISTNVAVFPTLILIAFIPDDGIPAQQETHLLSVVGDLDVDKLGYVDELANNVGDEDTPLVLAYWRLKAIATSTLEFGMWWRLASFAVSSLTAAVMFFKGNLWDAVVAGIFGLVIGLLDMIALKSALFSSVIEFTSAFVVSFTARLITVHIPQLDTCYFAMALSSLVWLLPGLSLTVGVSELVAKAHVTGTAHLMYALFSALQLGFGLAIGENLVWWAHHDIKKTCSSPDLPYWWNLFWFTGYAISSNVLLRARLNQWPGMTLSALVGYIVSELTSKFGSDASSVMAAFAVGLSATLYSQWTGHLPLSMVLSGILLLVPGGIGVQGVAAMLEKDVLSGMGFVFDMMVVGLSITIGLLMAKLIMPQTYFGNGKEANTSTTLAEDLEKDEEVSDSDDEEHMAI